jgi:cytoskeletal protein CcmA (bactofilin family)
MAGRLDGRFQSTDVVVRAGAVVICEETSVSTGTCLVAGAISGPVQANQLKVEASGQLKGHITATQMDVHGHVQGEVNVGDMVVRSEGTLDGQVVYGNLSMERGSDVSGQLQRKGRHSAPAAAKADQTVVIHLPVNIVQQLRKNPDSLQLSLANGDPQPSWISVDREHAWLVLGKTEFDQLSARGETLTLRLQAGTENLVFTLPPDAQ